jgi:hypothetical protein
MSLVAGASGKPDDHRHFFIIPLVNTRSFDGAAAGA